MRNFLILSLLFFIHKTTAEGDLDPIPCTCGVFLSGQISKESKNEVTGKPAFTIEAGATFADNSIGLRQCMNKCLEQIVKFLPKSADIICGTMERDCYKEKAYLFVKNHSKKWINSNMSAGREYCCKDNTPYKCPI
ncbi:follicle cell protein 3C-1 isoform X2 [Onthophagus taurus]|nr:follicle cell protein 3C-1 [Onthophagus taurus]